MGSNELGSYVDTELTSLSINTATEVKGFRIPGIARTGNMKTVRDAISTARGKYYTSRKRVRSDALRLLREGAL